MHDNRERKTDLTDRFYGTFTRYYLYLYKTWGSGSVVLSMLLARVWASYWHCRGCSSFSGNPSYNRTFLLQVWKKTEKFLFWAAASGVGWLEVGKIRPLPRVLHQTSRCNARNMVTWYSSLQYNQWYSAEECSLKMKKYVSSSSTQSDTLNPVKMLNSSTETKDVEEPTCQ